MDPKSLPLWGRCPNAQSAAGALRPQARAASNRAQLGSWRVVDEAGTQYGFAGALQ